jgi:lipoprotein signal peptidase
VGIGLLDFLIQLYFSKIGWGVENKGISFGILVPNILWIVAFGLVMVIGKGSKLLLAGALGNLLSRLILGFVFDYIKIPMIGLWFNFSDVMIMIGVGTYIWNTK